MKRPPIVPRPAAPEILAPGRLAKRFKRGRSTWAECHDPPSSTSGRTLHCTLTSISRLQLYGSCKGMVAANARLKNLEQSAKLEVDMAASLPGIAIECGRIPSDSCSSTRENPLIPKQAGRLGRATTACVSTLPTGQTRRSPQTAGPRVATPAPCATHEGRKQPASCVQDQDSAKDMRDEHLVHQTVPLGCTLSTILLRHSGVVGFTSVQEGHMSDVGGSQCLDGC